MIIGHDKRGRFTTGNPGRPPGSVNRPRRLIPADERRTRTLTDDSPETPVLLRFHALLDDIISDLGGRDGLSTGQLQLARRCAWISAQCEAMEQRDAAGETVNPLVYGVLTGHLARAFRSIGVERRPPTLSLQAYLSATQQPVESDEGESDLVVVANADEQG